MALPRQQTRTVAGVTYTLTRRRVRNINLRVRADGSVAASAAPRVSVMKVDAFVASKADWVRSAQARVAARREQEAAQQPELPTRAEALAHIQVLCRAYYPQFAATCPGGHMPKIAVRDMTTRWGSCSLKTGTLAFARRLCVAPLPAQEYVVVHDGAPGDSTAANYYVRYRDYIKNVASSEIYATWPDATIRANVLAIMSFTLNRVYTEWYRGKGYVFTITSSTAYDHKFIYGRNFFQSISQVVDEMFENYLSRPNVRQPILTQYCDGQRVTCPDWMSQWGSKYLGDQGYSAIDILRSYYGNDMYINSAEGISGIPASWPGYDLGVGASGPKVRQLQEQLARISRAYPAIPTITADGVYGSRTREAVEKFQSVFGLPVTGIVDYPTWYKISDIYVAVSRIAELV